MLTSPFADSITRADRQPPHPGVSSRFLNDSSFDAIIRKNGDIRARAEGVVLAGGNGIGTRAGARQMVLSLFCRNAPVPHALSSTGGTNCAPRRSTDMNGLRIHRSPFALPWSDEDPRRGKQRRLVQRVAGRAPQLLLLSRRGLARQRRIEGTSKSCPRSCVCP